MKPRLLQTALFAALLLFGLSPAMPLHAQGMEGWTEDQPKAVAQAKAEKKLVFMDFTGSDWCPWCQKIDKEVFSTPEFKQYAKDHLVLVRLDFPQETPQDPAIRKRNIALGQQYNTEGVFPLQVVLSPEGKTIKVFEGFPQGGVQELLAQLKQLKS